MDIKLYDKLLGWCAHVNKLDKAGLSYEEMQARAKRIVGELWLVESGKKQYNVCTNELIEELLKHDDRICREATEFLLKDSCMKIRTGRTVYAREKYKALKRCGSISEGADVKVIYIWDGRICVDYGSYALTEDEFINIFGEGGPTPESVRELSEEVMANDFSLLPKDDSYYSFYYDALRSYGLSIYDADRWAWLNTLFGYDIGAKQALDIITWYDDNGLDAFALEVGDRDTLSNICELELGFKPDFSRWAESTPEAIDLHRWEVRHGAA